METKVRKTKTGDINVWKVTVTTFVPALGRDHDFTFTVKSSREGAYRVREAFTREVAAVQHMNTYAKNIDDWARFAFPTANENRPVWRSSLDKAVVAAEEATSRIVEATSAALAKLDEMKADAEEIVSRLKAEGLPAEVAVFSVKMFMRLCLDKDAEVHYAKVPSAYTPDGCNCTVETVKSLGIVKKTDLPAAGRQVEMFEVFEYAGEGVRIPTFDVLLSFLTARTAAALYVNSDGRSGYAA